MQPGCEGWFGVCARAFIAFVETDQGAGTCPEIISSPEKASRMRKLLDIGARSAPAWDPDLEAAFKAEMLRQIERVCRVAAHDLASPVSLGQHQGESTAAAPLSLVFVHSESRVATVVRVRSERVSQHGIGVARLITWLPLNAGGARCQDCIGNPACRPVLRVVAAGASGRRGTTSWWPTAHARAVVVRPGRSSTARWSAALATRWYPLAAANTRGTSGTMRSGLCVIVHPIVVLLVCLQAGGAGQAAHKVCARCGGVAGFVLDELRVCCVCVACIIQPTLAFTKKRHFSLPAGLRDNAIKMVSTEGVALQGTLGTVDVEPGAGFTWVQVLAGSVAQARELLAGPRALDSMLRTVAILPAL